MKEKQQRSSDPEVVSPEGLWHQPEVEAAFVEDPLFKFLKGWWQTGVAALAVVALGYMVVGWYQDSQLQARKRAGATYFNVREGFEQYQQSLMQEQIEAKKDPAERKQPDEKVKAEQLAKLQEMLKTQRDQGGVYAEIATFYERALQQNNQSAAPAAATEAGKGDIALLGELDRLLRARTLVATDKTREEGLKELSALAANANFAAPAAAWVLANVAQSDGELETARKAVDQVLTRFPEQSDLLKGAREIVGS